MPFSHLLCVLIPSGQHSIESAESVEHSEVGIVPTYSANHDRLPDVTSVPMFGCCCAANNRIAVSISARLPSKALQRKSTPSIRRPSIGDGEDHRRRTGRGSNERDQAARIDAARSRCRLHLRQLAATRLQRPNRLARCAWERGRVAASLRNIAPIFVILRRYTRPAAQPKLARQASRPAAPAYPALGDL
jgi:hypothetical protein